MESVAVDMLRLEPRSLSPWCVAKGVKAMKEGGAGLSCLRLGSSQGDA